MIYPVVDRQKNLVGCINDFNNLFIECSDCGDNSSCKFSFVRGFHDAVSSVSILETESFHSEEEDM